MGTQKAVVFISHITEEREIAVALKKLLDTVFLGQLEIFISSDPDSISMGRKWLDKITDALKRCAVEIVLVSRTSVKRPWVNFEAGAGWIRDIPVIPLCHSGMVVDGLPPPLNQLRSANATDAPNLKLIVPVFCEAIGCNEPSIDFSDFVEVVKKFEDLTRATVAIAAKSGEEPVGELQRHELQSLLEIAGSLSSPHEAQPTRLVRESMIESGYNGAAANIALLMLERKNLIELVKGSDYNGNEFSEVRVTQNGWQWLIDNSKSLVLHRDDIHMVRSIPSKPPNLTSPPPDEIPF